MSSSLLSLISTIQIVKKFMLVFSRKEMPLESVSNAVLESAKWPTGKLPKFHKITVWWIRWEQVMKNNWNLWWMVFLMKIGNPPQVMNIVVTVYITGIFHLPFFIWPLFHKTSALKKCPYGVRLGLEIKFEMEGYQCK